MTSPMKHLCSAVNGFRNVLLYIFFITITPLFVLFYFLCWTRAKITSLICLNDKQTMLSGEDVGASLVDNPVNRTMNGFYLIDDHFTAEEMKELFLNKVINAKDDNNKPLFPKFTHHIIARADYLVWSEENVFDIDDHIRLYHGQPPRDDDELKKLVNGICNSVLDPSKPCWELLIIPLEYGHEDDPKTCLFVRVEHSITDAVSLGRLFYEQICGLDDNDLMKTLFKNMEDKVKSKSKNKLVTMLENVAQHLFAFVVAPSAICRQGLGCGQSALQRTAPSGSLMFDWTTVAKLSTVKEIKNATGTTINDVFMSCTAAALRKLFVELDVSPPDSLHVALPVNLQGPNDPITMKNKVSFVILPLPTGEMDCLKRLKTTKASMDKLKRSSDVITNRWFIQHYFSVIPNSILRLSLDKYEASAIVSNVPGPLSPPAFNGHPLRTAVALPQIRGNAGVAVTILTYAGDVKLSVTVDTAVVKHEDSVHWLLDGFDEEMQQLYYTVIGTPSAPVETKIH